MFKMLLSAPPRPFTPSIFIPDGGGESNGLDTANEEVYPCSGNVELDTLPSTTLTEEQQQRIKRNRQLALERRQAKMQCNSQSQHNGKNSD